MKAQEEEMRQNLEELHATQEEMARKEMDMKDFYDAIDKTYNKVEFSPEGNIIAANKKYLELMGYTFEELNGKNIRSFVSDDFLGQFESRWNGICAGQTSQTAIKSKTKDGREITLFISYIPIKDKDGEHPYAVSAGFLEVRANNELVILADRAERADTIDLVRAEESRKRAEEEMKKAKAGQDVDYARLQALIDKEMNRIRVGNKYRKLK